MATPTTTVPPVVADPPQPDPELEVKPGEGDDAPPADPPAPTEDPLLDILRADITTAIAEPKEPEIVPVDPKELERVLAEASK